MKVISFNLIFTLYLGLELKYVLYIDFWLIFGPIGPKTQFFHFNNLCIKIKEKSIDCW